LKLAVRANARREKTPVLLELHEVLDKLKVLLRLGQDVNAFTRAITQVMELTKQNEGWLKSQDQRQNWRAMPHGLAPTAGQDPRGQFPIPGISMPPRKVDSGHDLQLP